MENEKTVQQYKIYIETIIIHIRIFQIIIFQIEKWENHAVNKGTICKRLFLRKVVDISRWTTCDMISGKLHVYSMLRGFSQGKNNNNFDTTSEIMFLTPCRPRPPQVRDPNFPKKETVKFFSQKMLVWVKNRKNGQK